MKKNIVPAIITISLISLIGVFISEVALQKDYEIKKSRFNSKVTEALLSIVDQLGNYNPGTSDSSMSIKDSYCCSAVENIGEIIPIQYFDSIVKSEFKKHSINIYYEYGIFCNNHNNMILGEFGKYKNNLLKSIHSLRLTCLWERESVSLGVYFPDENSYINDQSSYWLFSIIIFYIILTLSIATSIYYIIKERKLSILKNNFINNMAHEFKTPMSTIALTSELLFKPEIYESHDKISQYATIIHEENNKLIHNVDRILQIALLEKGKLKLNKENIDVHSVLNSVIKNFSVKLENINGKISTNYSATKYYINVDNLHFYNILNNLIDNSIKYCTAQPEIIISTKNNDKGLIINISDNGIGINNENQKHIFKQFFRVDTGNIQDIRGFGLGLFYVKTMIEEHNGTVKIQSEINKGSNFEIFLPF